MVGIYARLFGTTIRRSLNSVLISVKCYLMSLSLLSHGRTRDPET
jgi:hypothetical protein